MLYFFQDDIIYHGIGQANTWKHLTRDLVVDLQKGLALQYQDKTRKKLPKTKIKVSVINIKFLEKVSLLFLIF